MLFLAQSKPAGCDHNGTHLTADAGVPAVRGSKQTYIFRYCV